MKNSGIGTASLVLGIVAIVFGFIPMLGLWSLPLGLLAIVLAIVDFKKAKKNPGQPRGFSVTGLVTGILATIAGLVHVAIFMFIGAVATGIDQSIQDTSSETYTESVESSAPAFDDATASAQSYVDLDDFSKEGLALQLEFEGFSQDEIDKALEEVVVDYKEEALGSANYFFETDNLTDQGLRDQLDFEGFTESEIDYAVSNIN